jgi:hypothetical protein
VETLTTDRHFRGAECISMRDSWDNPAGFHVAMQGGANNWTHRHYDLGSFILEANGVRWIIDSGRESQTYHRHVNHTPRGDFYRVRAEGHNTLVINPDEHPGQADDAMAVFSDFISNPKDASASLDLTDAYKEHAGSVRRSFQLVRGKSFAVSDEIRCYEPSEICSYFHTQAAVELAPDKRKATLSQAGKSMEVTLVSPRDATFEILPAQPGPASPKPAKQASNEDRRKLAVRLTDVRSANIKVVFSMPPH